MTVVAVQGDLTRMEVDVVVNAANAHLAHGGGVAAALSRAAGPELDRESRAWVAERGPVGDGQAAVTTAGALPARWVVHVVGPVHREGQDNAGLLERAVTAALNAAEELGAASIALPAISAGIFGYPLEQATAVIARTCLAWERQEAQASLTDIRLVGFDDQAVEAFSRALHDAG